MSAERDDKARLTSLLTLLWETTRAGLEGDAAKRKLNRLRRAVADGNFPFRSVLDTFLDDLDSAND